MELNPSPTFVVLKVSNSKGLKFGAPCRARTCDHPLRRRMLYPTELMALGGGIKI